MCHYCIDGDVNIDLRCNCSNCLDAKIDENGEFNCLSCKHCGNINKEDIKEEMFDPYIGKENHDGWVRSNDDVM